jgi:hypothetical protein
MPFRVKEFPGQLFNNMDEYREAQTRRKDIERELANRASAREKEPHQTRVTATLIPADRELVEKRVAMVESKLGTLIKEVDVLKQTKPPEKNKEGLKVGTTLWGESKGNRFTLEVLGDDYLCSNGEIYQSLSGAALGVSDNRRSGWVFWKDINGIPIGEITGRLKSEPKGSRGVP